MKNASLEDQIEAFASCVDEIDKGISYIRTREKLNINLEKPISDVIGDLIRALTKNKMRNPQDDYRSKYIKYIINNIKIDDMNTDLKDAFEKLSRTQGEKRELLQACRSTYLKTLDISEKNTETPVMNSFAGGKYLMSNSSGFASREDIFKAAQESIVFGFQEIIFKKNNIYYDVAKPVRKAYFDERRPFCVNVMESWITECIYVIKADLQPVITLIKSFQAAIRMNGEFVFKEKVEALDIAVYFLGLFCEWWGQAYNEESEAHSIFSPFYGIEWNIYDCRVYNDKFILSSGKIKRIVETLSEDSRDACKFFRVENWPHTVQDFENAFEQYNQAIDIKYCKAEELSAEFIPNLLRSILIIILYKIKDDAIHQFTNQAFELQEIYREKGILKDYSANGTPQR